MPKAYMKSFFDEICFFLIRLPLTLVLLFYFTISKNRMEDFLLFFHNFFRYVELFHITSEHKASLGIKSSERLVDD